LLAQRDKQVTQRKPQEDASYTTLTRPQRNVPESIKA